MRFSLRMAFLLTALVALLVALRLFVGYKAELSFMAGGYAYPVRTTLAQAEQFMGGTTDEPGQPQEAGVCRSPAVSRWMTDAQNW